MPEETFEFNEKLDGEYLESIYDNDKEHAEMVFDKFITSVDTYLDEINNGYKSGNLDNFKKSLHKFKPVLSYVGLTKLTGTAQSIEKKCSEISDVNNLAAMYNAFIKELKEMLPIIKNDWQKLKALTS